MRSQPIEGLGHGKRQPRPPLLWVGVTLGMFLWNILPVEAQTRAARPVRIEAKTAQNEQVSYIYAESHALVIGVSRYTNGWSNLPGVREDVEEVSQALQANGFEVTRLEDPGLDELEQAIEDFIFEKGVESENRLLIYYAGHGHTMTLGYGGEMGFLVPSDAPVPQKGRDARFRRQALSMQRIEEVAKNTSAKHVLFMFDACFAGSVFLATRAAPAYIQQNTKEPVRQFITSGSAEQEVPDQSIFRRAFVDALEGKADYDRDGYLTGTELGAYIQKRTAEDWEGKLTPQYGKLQDPNLNKGDFVFDLRRPEPPPPPAPPKLSQAEQAWQIIENSENPAAFEMFLQAFPESPQAVLAKLKLLSLSPPATSATPEIVEAEPSPSKPEAEPEAVAPPLEEIFPPQPEETAALVPDEPPANNRSPAEDSLPNRIPLWTTSYNNLSIGPSPAEDSSRYRIARVLVEDLEQGLMWQRQDDGKPRQFADAADYCRSLALAGWTDWRLPKIRELRQLIDEDRRPAKINREVFEVRYQNFATYWSATPSGANPNQVWFIDFLTGQTNTASRTNYSFALCVRSMADAEAPTTARVSSTPNLAENSLEPSLDREVYQQIQANSRDTEGCGFFHIGCEDPLVLPPYQPSFHVKDYRRIKLWGSSRPWLETGLQVERGERVVFFGTGEVTTCPHSSCSYQGPRSLGKGNVSFKVGEEDFPLDLQFPRKQGTGYTAELYMPSSGMLFLTVRDWSTYPPPSSYYEDNSGSYLLDAFVIDPEQEEAFLEFRDAVIRNNPEDPNVQAYHARP